MIEKLKFIIYKDEKFQEKAGHEIDVQVNPEDFTEKKSIVYTNNNGSVPLYKGVENENISIKFTLDGTGVIPSGEPVVVSERIEELETWLYSPHKNQKGELLPYFVLISWGKLLFKGRVQNMEVHYTLFKGNGEPLRATVSLILVRVVTEKKEETPSPGNRQDQAKKDKVVTVKSGETLPYLCRREYGDSTLDKEIAKKNNLTSMRGIKAGDKLIFPCLQ